MDVWHESVPERDGQATADLALPGCSTGIGLGQYHFADAREFDYEFSVAGKVVVTQFTVTVE